LVAVGGGIGTVIGQFTLIARSDNPPPRPQLGISGREDPRLRGLVGQWGVAVRADRSTPVRTKPRWRSRSVAR